MIKSSGYAQTLLVWGIIQAAIGVVAALGMKVPPESYQPEGFDPGDRSQNQLQTRRSYTPREMLLPPRPALPALLPPLPVLVPPPLAATVEGHPSSGSNDRRQRQPFCTEVLHEHASPAIRTKTGKRGPR